MISVCILTRNCAATLPATLGSCRSFPEVFLLDNGSTDDTLALARAYPNVRIEKAPFIGFGPLRNQAAALATHDWILALDSDEVLAPFTPPPLDPACAYVFERHNYFRGQRIRGAGWGNDRVARLYHRAHARYSDSQVHERLLTTGLREVLLPTPLLHTPYRSYSDFLEKMQRYTTLYAEQNRGKPSSLTRALLHSWGAFLKGYFLQQGFRDGSAGFILSLYNAQTAYYKYLKLTET